MKKWLKLLIWIIGVSIGLIIILWLGLALIIQQQKKALLSQINDKLNEELEANVTIADIEPTLLRSFPNISVALIDVSIKDSLWNSHRRSLLEVKNIFLKVNTFSILKKKIDIKEVSFEDGQVYLYTDSTGYTNTSAFKLKDAADAGQPKKNRLLDIQHLVFKDMQLFIEHVPRHKYFHIDIKSMSGEVIPKDSVLDIRLVNDIHLPNIEFNQEKGSFFKDKRLWGKLYLKYHTPSQLMEVPQQDIHIDMQTYNITGSFSFLKDHKNWQLYIIANKLPFQEGLSILSSNISSKLDTIEFEKPLDIRASLNGILRYPDTPLIHVQWQTLNNNLLVKGSPLTDCSFHGEFYNEVVPGLGHNDPNSMIRIEDMKAKYFGVPFQADSVTIHNLTQPVLKALFRSSFRLSNLNELTAGTFKFDSGHATALLKYEGGILPSDTIIPTINGNLNLENGAFEYLPRNIKVQRCNVILNFKDTDLYMDNFILQTKSSKLALNGIIKNITTLYFNAPEKALISWNIESPRVDLNEFKFLLAQRKKITPARKHQVMSRFTKQLDAFLDASNVEMDVNIDEVNYRHFKAANVHSFVGINQDAITLKKLGVQHAGGKILVDGKIGLGQSQNPFNLDASIQQVHINQLFYAFENFGIDALTSNNLKGIFSANANITGKIKDNGELLPHSFFGKIKFDLRKGALLNFGPLEDISKFIFKKRNLDNVEFERIQNTLELKGDKIIIPPMQISSSAINLDVEGVYGIVKGTDIYMTVPLRNPKKDEGLSKEEKAKRRNKGIVLHLHATDDGQDDGKVKIKLGKKKDK